MDIFPQKKLGWFPTLRQAPGHSTFSKPRFLRIQWYPNFHMRRISFWNRRFASDFFLRSSCTLKLSIFWGGTGYCYVISLSKAIIRSSSLWTEWTSDGPSSSVWQSSILMAFVCGDFAWLQSDLLPISCQCIDKTACTVWSDDIMFLS